VLAWSHASPQCRLRLPPTVEDSGLVVAKLQRRPGHSPTVEALLIAAELDTFTALNHLRPPHQGPTTLVNH